MTLLLPGRLVADVRHDWLLRPTTVVLAPKVRSASFSQSAGPTVAAVCPSHRVAEENGMACRVRTR